MAKRETLAIGSFVGPFQHGTELSVLTDLLMQVQEAEILGREGEIGFLLTIGEQKCVAVDFERLDGLRTEPGIGQSTDLIVSALQEGTSVVFLTGAMRSGKSKVFNRVVTKAFEINLEKDFWIFCDL